MLFILLTFQVQIFLSKKDIWQLLGDRNCYHNGCSIFNIITVLEVQACQVKIYDFLKDDTQSFTPLGSVRDSYITDSAIFKREVHLLHLPKAPLEGCPHPTCGLSQPL